MCTRAQSVVYKSPTLHKTDWFIVCVSKRVPGHFKANGCRSAGSKSVCEAGLCEELCY